MTQVMPAQPAAFGSALPPAQPAYDQPIDYQAAPDPYAEPYADGYPETFDRPEGAPPRSSRAAKIGVAVAAGAILVIVVSLITLGGGKDGPAAAPANGPTTDVVAPTSPATTDQTTAPSATGPSSVPSSQKVPGQLQFGDTGPEVKWLQTRLHQIGMYNGPVSGVFDQATAAAVSQFQGHAHPSDPAGVVGRSTRTALIAWGSRPRLALVGPLGGDGGKKGKVNPDDVKRLQKALGSALNQNIKASGTFDPETFGAVMAYQGSVGLPPDGVVNDRVWAALQSGKLPGQNAGGGG
jgi:peptidoglycan hydrolase-like protein with peptidoglycan-binding domain